MTDFQTKIREYELRVAYGEVILTSPEIDRLRVELFLETPPGRKGKGAMSIPRRLRRCFSHQETTPSEFVEGGFMHEWQGLLTKKQFADLLDAYGFSDSPHYNSFLPLHVPGLNEERITFSLSYIMSIDSCQRWPPCGLITIDVFPDLTELPNSVLCQVTAPVEEFPNKGLM